jgi:heat shock transcription factor 1
MKQENEALWREIAVLRQKHMKQQQIVNKLIQFLVTLVQPTRGGTGINSMSGVKRRFQLMINDVPESSKKRKKSQDSGPVIHELTEDLLDDCNYDYDVPIDSPTILSPAAFSTANDGNVDEDDSSPANFKIEKIKGFVDNPDSDLNYQSHEASDEPNDEVNFVTDKVPENSDWDDLNNVTVQSQQEPVQEYLISYVTPPSKDKSHTATNIVTKPVIAGKSQGTSLLNSQQSNKKRPQLVLKMNKPIRNDGKIIQSVIGPGKVVLANKATTSTSVKTENQNKDSSKVASKTYTNKNDFIGSDMPNDLFELQEDSTSPMFSSDTNLASGSYNPSLSNDYTKKLSPNSKNLAVAKYNNNRQDCDDVQLNTPEDVNKYLDTTEGDLHSSLKELFQADSDYSLDANALFGNSSGSSSAKNRLLLSPSVDSELFSKIFGDLDAPFGLSLNSDFPMDKRDDAGASGSELITYQPYNSLDLSEIMDHNSTLTGICDQQNENAEDDPLLNAPELNTPRIDKKSISFNTK